MKRYLIFIATILVACGGNDPEVDTTYPEVDMKFSEAFPAACQVLERGQTYTFKMRFTDNQELGSYSLDIHNNFNHHTHNTDETEHCDEEPIKTAVNAFTYIRDYAIPTGTREYMATATVSVPNDVDTGDYHLSIKLTDQAGWATFHRMGIKIK